MGIITKAAAQMSGCFLVGGNMETLFVRINKIVWGVPTLFLILGIGVYLSLQSGFAQLQLMPRALRRFVCSLKNSNNDDGISGYRALCTALAATVGVGNIVGVAGAIALGGPGTVFWMWVCALLGMITKLAEVVLSVFYRHKNRKGEYVGGPMYAIRCGMGKKWHWLATVYCLFGVIASFGVGNATQINAVIGGIDSVVSAFGGFISPALRIILGILFAVLIISILLGGAKRIGKAAENLIPAVSLLYILLCIVVLLFRFGEIPGSLRMIIVGAFKPQAITGGMVGSILVTLRIGASRGVFTNEAGMGTAAIAHASADVNHPVEKGLMGIVEVFVDTILICTLTALVILTSGISIDYGTDTGIQLAIQAYSEVLGDWVAVPLAIAVSCFALGTILGWSLYGLRCAEFLFGERVYRKFVYIQGVVIVISSVLGTGIIWTLAEIVNGLMVIPNLIALEMLSPRIIHLINTYKREPDNRIRLSGY